MTGRDASAVARGPTAADPALRAFLAGVTEGARRFMGGDPGPWLANASRADDVLILGAWGGWERGWPAAEARYRWAAARFAGGEAKLDLTPLGVFEGPDLAVTVAVERATVRIAGQADPAPMALRVTHVLRREDGDWRLVLRHAAPLVGRTAPDAVPER
ncbi:nuclear transport factor 2 family protein [Amaricoccus sp.]|uniref:YybH family protein n=1 Tax=Amaricoccus sp. TaxID=1872485 RepID=UPI001B499B58|nr:nuclear transport factor 2 family protein [Amaricoccus sp.]MBP7001651.1 nuclear transport factor 2 family protein [Amaricoccus sp.]